MKKARNLSCGGNPAAGMATAQAYRVCSTRSPQEMRHGSTGCPTLKAVSACLIRVTSAHGRQYIMSIVEESSLILTPTQCD
eukprot:c45466_g1_i1 orf=112-354(-)